MKKVNDIAVIGGGAAGLFFAVTVKRLVPEASVTVFEANDRVGKKLAITGNGRCNITNRSASAEDYHGDGMLAERTLKGFDYEAQKAFFESLGVYFKTENDKVYPSSLQAASVVDALRFEAEESGAELKCGCRVSAIRRENGGFSVETESGTDLFKSAVIACGGRAGGKLGSISGYEILRSLGHKIEPVFPSVVPLKTETEIVRRLKGIKVDATVTAESSLGVRTESGEVLFCDYGISGPPVMQVSRLAEGQNARVILDLMPDFGERKLADIIEKTVTAHPERPISELFTGLLHKKLGQVITRECGIDINRSFSTLQIGDIKRISQRIKHFELKVTGTMGFENAQVTAGGAQTAQFFDSFMSKKAKGLFAIGEVLNVDGDCGGFNLAFAWSSAYAAARGMAEYLNGDVK